MPMNSKCNWIALLGRMELKDDVIVFKGGGLRLLRMASPVSRLGTSSQTNILVVVSSKPRSDLPKSTLVLPPA